MLRLVKTLLILLLAVQPAIAVTPSPAMMEQFKQLPRAEQERLAKQYGYDLSAMERSSGRSQLQTSQPEVLQPEWQINSQMQSEKKAVINDIDPNKPKRFGLDLFNANVATFAQVNNMPVPDSYILGPDDTLLLQLFGKENNRYDLVVSRDGVVNLPDVGPVKVAGLRFNIASELLVSRIQESKIGVNAAVSMGQLRTINIFIAGEAKRPGSYTVSALTSVTQALFIAGGVSDIGSLRDIKVNRAGKTVSSFDLYSLLLRGDSRGDIHLQHGDVVFVAPVKAIAEVKGEVQRPALYEVVESNTLADLLQMAGGTKPGSYPRSAVLERFNQNNLRDLQNLDLTSAKAQKLVVKGGDVLTIAATSPRVEQAIKIIGSAVRPGQYAWQQGIKVSGLLTSLWSDLHMETDLDYALIAREINNAGDLEILQFNLGNAITHPGSIDDLTLHARDTVIILPYGYSVHQRDMLYTELKKQTRKSTVAPEADILKQTDFGFVTSEQEQQIQFHLDNLVSNLYNKTDLLNLSAYLTRTELLQPLISKLNQQARHNQQPRLVTITGNVKVPGTYPLANNAVLSDLIAAASGLKQSAFTGRAELTRAVFSNVTSSVEAQHTAINLNDVFNGQHNPILQPRDNLNIFETPDWDIERSITLQGEVRFPGVYTIQPTETLADVIQRAGGLTEHAFIKGAVYTREAIKQKEAAQMKKLSEQLRADVAGRALSTQGTLTSPADAALMLQELEKIQPVGRLVIDLENVISGNPLYNERVQNGDLLYIPRINNTISILGEVQHASSHRYDPKLSVEDYLKLAGNFRKRADEERTYVIRADGSVMIPQNRWFSVSANRLQPGDTIVVPLDTEYKDNITLWAQITQIFYQSAVAIAALNSF